MDEYKQLEELGQTNMFDFLEEPKEGVKEEPKEEQFYIGQKVLVSLNRMDEESKNYFKYYHPGVIAKEGYITEISEDQIEVFVNGSHIQMKGSELI